MDTLPTANHYPGATNTYIPSFPSAPEPASIEYVREHGTIVSVRGDHKAATVEVVKDGVVSFCRVTLTKGGNIADFEPRLIVTYARYTPEKK